LPKNKALFDAVVKDFPGVGSLKFPPRGPDAEKSSLLVHTKLLNEKKKLIKQQPVSFDAIKFLVENLDLQSMEDDFTVTIPRLWDMMCAYHLSCNTKAHPGVPAYVLADEKDTVLKTHLANVIKAGFHRAVRRIAFYYVIKENNYDYRFSAEQLVVFGLCDPIRLMIKDEPHSLKKQLQGRHRLIWVCSMFDEMADKAFLRLDKLCIDQWRNLPMKPGAPLGHQQGDANMIQFMKRNPKLKSTDVSYFDWMYNEDLHRCNIIARYGLKTYDYEELERLYLNPLEVDDFYWAGLYVQHLCHMRKVIVLSDGNMYGQQFTGINPSGNAGTTNHNNFGRLLVHAEACVQSGVRDLQALVFGDDCVTQYGDELKDEDAILRDFGVIVKEDETIISENDGHHTMSFCSRRYDMWIEGDELKCTDTFLNVDKLLSSYLHSNRDKQHQDSVEMELGVEFVEWLNSLERSTGGLEGARKNL